MFSLDVINTDAFLDMPQSSQLLYFHLNVRADDDGFVSNPKSIMRNCGSQADDLKLLITKKFIIAFEDGVCVVKHWRINNYVRKDIYKETKYLNHKQTLFIRPNGIYTLTDDGHAIPIPRGHFQIEDIKLKKLKNGQPKQENNVHVSSTERALSIGKDRLGKVKNTNTVQPTAAVQEIMAIFYDSGINKALNFGNKTQRAAAEWLLKEHTQEDAKKIVTYACSIQGEQYAPTITTPYQLKEKYGQLQIYYRRKQSSLVTEIPI